MNDHGAAVNVAEASANWEWLVAWGTVGLVVATVALAVVAYAQLRAERERRLESETLQSCTRFDIDPILYQANRRIWDAARNGPDRSKVDYTKADEHDVITVANYLDGIAIGVLQGLYSDEIVRDHLGPSMGRYINTIIPAVFGNKDDYDAMVDVCSAWNAGKAVVAYGRKRRGGMPRARD